MSAPSWSFGPHLPQLLRVVKNSLTWASVRSLLTGMMVLLFSRYECVDGAEKT